MDGITGRLSPAAEVSGSLSARGVISGAVTAGGSALPSYEGPTEVTPGDAAQVLATKNTTLLEDITVGPVPAGYGKISWDGSVLTVS